MPSSIHAATPKEVPAAKPAFPSGQPVQLHAALSGLATQAMSQSGAAPAQLSPRARAQPLFDLGMTCLANGQPQAAIAAFRQATDIDPRMSEAWRGLGDVSLRVGDAAAANHAYVAYAACADEDAELAQAAAALEAGKIGIAERTLIQRLQKMPNDVAAMRLLAESRMMVRRYADTETLLARVLELAPGFARARHNYAVVLFRQGKIEPAVANLEQLRASDPDNVHYQMLLASCLTLIGQHRGAIGLYEAVLRERPDYADAWLGYGNALRYTGRRDDAVGAYRAAMAQAPNRGEAYWNIANLKTEALSAEERGVMQAQLADTGLGAKDRMLIHFALGESFERSQDYAASFSHYAAGAALRRAQISYSADEHTALVRRMIDICSPALLATRAGQAVQAADTHPTPIFVVGMPRAGSTLVEQILASHSAVEGTRELPEIGNISRHLAARFGQAGYPECLTDLSAADLAALGARYIQNTRIFRTRGTPYFIDKMPPNWLHCGLIHMILPGAKIIDVRRAPMASCFAAFKQYFGHGQNASYDLTEIGRHYCDYVTLMAHFDQVMPGRIHRVHYEDLVNHTESETRRLLAYCGLPFEPACLRFWETDRDVATPSSEQVRQPIFRAGLEQWRHYEAWLGPLQDALRAHGMS